MAKAGVWAEEDGSDVGGDDDDDDDDVYRVVTSVASADEVREAMRAAGEGVDEFRAVLVASSSLGFSEHRCESGKAVATSGRLAPEGGNEDFTGRSSDIVKNFKQKKQNKRASKKARKGRGHG